MFFICLQQLFYFRILTDSKTMPPTHHITSHLGIQQLCQVCSCECMHLNQLVWMHSDLHATPLSTQTQPSFNHTPKSTHGNANVNHLQHGRKNKDGSGFEISNTCCETSPQKGTQGYFLSLRSSS